ncbi:lipid-A-disaccharide synthase [Roseovarius sp. 2305UL8-3]|uniref:lipid-A-disaccharide synthase n=1 Tax=Roseovarius conchicola TaxID=3121636 RepID=UPI0035277F0E
MRVFLVAGEPSGDKLGAALMAGLKSLGPVEFSGLAGPLMQAEGMDSLFPMDELSVIGISEILPKYLHLRRRLHQTAEAILEAKPDVLITIDSPEFCLRLAKLVKAKSDIRTVHYVAPSVWAWRPGRAKKMAPYIDQVLALLPFEPPYMEAEGMDCDFVGHPVVAESAPSAEQVQAFRDHHGFGENPVLLVLPGSRRSEVRRLAPIFGESLRLVLEKHPGLHLVVPTTSGAAAVLEESLPSWPKAPVVLSPNDMRDDDYLLEKKCAFHAANFALAASGTVSLELAAAGTPMVIAYDAAWLTRQIIAAMLKIDTLTLVNLISDTRAIPEFNGKDCRPELIGPGVLAMIEDHAAQTDAMTLTMDRLGRGVEAPGLRAAKAVMKRL